MNSNNNYPMNIIQQFVQFRNSFTGNPQAEVQKLLQSGRINQQQLNYLQTQASQLQNVLRSVGIKI